MTFNAIIHVNLTFESDTTGITKDKTIISESFIGNPVKDKTIISESFIGIHM